MATARHAVELAGLRHVFPGRGRSVQAMEAVRNVDLTVEPGEFVSIVGPSGCGKSTILKMIAGLLRPTEGGVRVWGEEVTGPRREIGIALQDATLLPWRDVVGNCLLPVELHGKVTDEARERVAGLLKRAGLAGFETRRPKELSGGMRQRVAICRALADDPTLLLLDEPFGALDALTREQMNIDLNRIWRETGKTAILITHGIEEAVLLSTRVVLLSERPGTIVDVITPPFPPTRTRELLSRPEFAEVCGQVRDRLFAGERAASATETGA
ncbi:ABC transporter ATP-binding protein [Spongiactinospora rosea]|uniref:ABC transporter ATP-binding protein n=1 Tax=Spongiactinospora rosea TaxID=2248750 RepID=A0A366LPG9_9ACTN|nr:ABC transporter ATP-binding protein [Spongiactinospora rosea]RBQ15727.1 ABC transporter ATP-binding protein [Spongiactinospora rosea]